MRKSHWLIMLGSTFGFLLSACALSKETITVPDVLPSTSEADESASTERELTIVTLLPRDGIPAIDDPEFLDATQADEEYAPEELVIGVDFNGDARAYSIPLLSSHEIVNDTVGGEKIAVTW